MEVEIKEHAGFEAKRRGIRMKVIYDPDTDTLSLIFRKEDIAESDEVREGVIIDYNKDGKIVSMEILDASEQISEPQGIVYELKGKEKIIA